MRQHYRGTLGILTQCPRFLNAFRISANSFFSSLSFFIVNLRIESIENALFKHSYSVSLCNPSDSWSYKTFNGLVPNEVSAIGKKLLIPLIRLFICLLTL